jgi:hypothetical protein
MATLDLSIIPLVKAGDRHGLHLLLSTCAESVLDDRDHVALPPDTFSDPIPVLEWPNPTYPRLSLGET